MSSSQAVIKAAFHMLTNTAPMLNLPSRQVCIAPSDPALDSAGINTPITVQDNSIEKGMSDTMPGSKQRGDHDGWQSRVHLIYAVVET